MRFGPVAFFLLAASFLFENLGFFTHEMNLLAGILLLGAAGLCGLPRAGDEASRPQRPLDRRSALLGAAALLLGLVLLPHEPMIRGTGLALIVFGFDALLRAVGRPQPELAPLMLTFVAYSFLMMLEKYVPGVWLGLQAVSVAVSKAVGLLPTLTGQPATIAGTTFTGLHTILLFGLFFSMAAALGERRHALIDGATPRLSAALSGYSWLAVAQVAYLWLFNNANVIFEWLEPIRSAQQKAVDYPFRSFLQAHFPANFPMVLGGLCLVGLYVFSRKCAVRSVGLAVRREGLLWVVAAAVLAGAAALSLSLPLPAHVNEEATFLFYRRGFLNYERPNYQTYGSYSAGMFGNLPVLCELLGFRAKLTEMDPASKAAKPLDPKDLDGVDVLVMINLNEPENPEDPADLSTYEAIRSFVRNGGSLLLLGDHTQRHDLKRPDGTVQKVVWSNELLKPTGIRFNFDSADFFVGGWLHSYRYSAHPLTLGMTDRENEAGSTVGASLTCRYPAVPLVMGTFGFSDRGDPRRADRGYLGDTMDYDPGEHLGDLVLAATQDFGKGRIVVFADTTGFVNGVATETHPFVSRVFTYLASDGHARRHPLYTIMPAFWLLAAGVCLARFGGHPAYALAPLMVALAVCVTCDARNTTLLDRVPRADRDDPSKPKLAYVDVSHGNKMILESWREDGTMGLHLNLQRAGYYSANLRHFDSERLKNSDLLLIIAPTQAYTRAEQRQILDFLRNGGHAIITAGWPDRGPIRSLLDFLMFDLADVPLGRFQRPVEAAGTNVMFWEVWPVSCSDPSARPIVAAPYENVSGRLHAIAPDGRPIWSEQVGGPVAIAPVIRKQGDAVGIYLVAGAQNDPVTKSPGNVVAFEPGGHVLWRGLTGQPIAQPPVVTQQGHVLLQTKAGTAARIIAGKIAPVKSAAGTTAFAATGEACTLGPNGIYYGTYPDLGLVAMTIEADELKQLWSYSEAKQFAGAPAVGPDGSVFVISTDGGKPALHAVGPDGKAIWTLPDAASLHVPLSPGPNGSVLAVNGDRTVALIAEGKPQWSFTCNGTPQMPATWAPDGTIYLAAIDAENPNNGWVYALDSSGRKRWEFHTDGQVAPEIAVSPGGSVYASTTAGLLYALSSDGTQQWQFRRDFEIYSPPAVGPDGTIYVAVRQMLYPVIVARDIGPGRVIVIGDSGFLLNYNLETEKEPESGMFHKPAIEFLKWLITTQLDGSQEAAK